MTPHGTLAQIGSFCFNVSPVLGVIGAVVVAFIQFRRPHGDNPKPAVGVTVDDDHADEAIAALRESRDDWRTRALAAEARLARLETP